MISCTEFIYSLVEDMGFSPETGDTVTRIVTAVFIVMLAIGADYLCKWIINGPLKRIAQKTHNTAPAGSMPTEKSLFHPRVRRPPLIPDRIPGPLNVPQYKTPEAPPKARPSPPS